MLRRSVSDADLQQWLSLVQPEINRRLKVNEREHTLTLSCQARATSIENAVTEEVVGVKALAATDRTVELTPLTTNAFIEAEVADAFQAQTAWTYSGGDLLLFPAPTAAEPLEVRAVIFRGYATPTNPTDTNWLLDNHQDLYAYGMAWKHAALRLIDNEQAAQYQSWFEGAVQELNDREEGAYHVRGARPYNVHRPLSRHGFGFRV